MQDHSWNYPLSFGFKKYPWNWYSVEEKRKKAKEK